MNKTTSLLNVSFVSYGKVNLSLHIKDYNNKLKLHDIESIMMPTKVVKDKIALKVLSLQNSQTKFIVKHIKPAIQLELTQNNTILRLLSILRKKYNFKNDVEIKLCKESPIASGLATGSANAVAVLKTINKILKLNSKQLQEIAFEIGSDCCFFLVNKLAIVSDFGKKVVELKQFNQDLKKLQIIVNQDVLSISKTVYCNYRKLASSDQQLQCSLQSIAHNYNDHLWHNDLQTVALKTNLQLMHKYTELKRKYKMVTLSGSGSAFLCF